MSTSIPPPPKGGASGKYAIIGLLLLLGAIVVIYFATRPSAQPPQHSDTSRPPAQPDAAVQPVLPRVGATIVIPESEPDAGVEAEAQTAAGDAGRRIRYVTRYVSECPGTVDMARVQAVVRQNYGGVRECYTRQLRSNPTLQGRATARLVINTNGSVGDVGSSGVVNRDRAFKSCFENALGRMRFPAPQRGCAIVEVPFNFSPQQ